MEQLDIMDRLNRGESRASEFLLRRRDGTYFPAAVTGSSILDEQGQLIGRIGLSQDITQRKQVEEEKARLFEVVNQQREQLRALTARLAEVQEAERQALAQELHDQVGRNLTALGLDLNIIWSQLAETSLGTGLIQARLDDSLALVEQITESIRDIMADLRPPVLDDFGLVAALRWYGRRFASRAGFNIAVQGEEPAPRLSSPVENVLFRIAQEALTNVAKHAQASQVTLRVEADKEIIRLIIADDGVGFEPAASSKVPGRPGWGRLIMRERANVLGGRCWIESAPGQGTRVIIEVAHT
jgi:two-component system sensor histidine kinase UhpB